MSPRSLLSAHCDSGATAADFYRHTVQPGNAAAQHRNLVEARAGNVPDNRCEARELVRLDIDEEKSGRLGGQAVFDLAGEVALDQCDGDEHRQADTEGKHDLRSRRARAVQIGERQAPGGAVWPGEPSRAVDHGRSCQSKECEGADRAADKPQSDCAIGRAGNREGSEPESQQ